MKVEPVGSMRARARFALLLSLLAGVQVGGQAAGAGLDFTLHKNEAGIDGNTLLVIGGIQGDEPGGFHAASLLATHYVLHTGSIWVVPNLNFESIIKRSRGIYGDMNRKFSNVSEDDPDFDRVEKIKRIIRDEAVDFVFNLHDGSGFYRPEYQDKLHNPRRWGQSIIIDQDRIDVGRHGDLGTVARAVAVEVNGTLYDPGHRYHVRNTRTREGDVEMEKTLTYFAINNGKPAVGVEASKSLATHMRVYYHLRVLEAYMARMGIHFERRFALTPAAVKRAVDDSIKVSFYGNRMFLDMSRVRGRLGYVPLKKDAGIEFTASSPLVAITGSGKLFKVSYGNRRVTVLHPQLFDYDASLSAVSMVLDDMPRTVRFGTLVDVADSFVVESPEGYRVNVIGWRKDNVKNERGIVIRRADIAKRFSVDRQGTTFRVEIYKDHKFSGMVLVRFGSRAVSATESVSPGVS